MRRESGHTDVDVDRLCLPQRFKAISFLRHLVDRMMENDLADVIESPSGISEWQITIDEVAHKFDAVVSQLPEWELQEPLGGELTV